MSLRKAWRRLGAFGPDAMRCVARARVAPAGSGWGVVERHEALR